MVPRPRGDSPHAMVPLVITSFFSSDDEVRFSI